MVWGCRRGGHWTLGMCRMRNVARFVLRHTRPNPGQLLTGSMLDPYWIYDISILDPC